jgi:hypothetical protein
MFGYVVKTKYKNLKNKIKNKIFIYLFIAVLLVIVNFQNHFIFLFLSFN